MAKNITQTLQGKPLDMGELIARNEKTRAIGNMAVNARGDGVDAANNTVATRTCRAGKNYRRQISNRVQDAPVMNSIKAAKIIARRYIEGLDTSGSDQTSATAVSTQAPQAETPKEAAAPKQAGPAPKPVAKKVEPVAPTVKPEPPAAEVKADPAPTDEVSEEVLERVMEEAAKPKGLAAAIAKAREVKQEPLKTPRREAREETG